MSVYIFDASIWIHINRYHPPDIFTSLWSRLLESVSSGHLLSPDEVLHELEKGVDDLAERLKRIDRLFVALEEEVQFAVSRVMKECPGLCDVEADRNRADPFVIALAMVRSGTVVSAEGRRRSNVARPRIPDACERVGVAHIDWFGFLRAQEWKV